MGMLSNSRFCKKSYGKHLEIVKKVFQFLSKNNGKIPNSYFKRTIKST